ncbi:hypothetical protein TNCV_2243111 [Trichonephila clavipes]|nr:hypothetical protein TNCV_2243111 [Trichonephila clavipes]
MECEEWTYAVIEDDIAGKGVVCPSNMEWRNSDDGQGLRCPSQSTWPLVTEVHDQISHSGGQSEVRPSVSKMGTHLSTHCRKDERLSRPYRVRR